MKKAALNSNQLKLIAIAAMTLDHLVWTICPCLLYTSPTPRDS